MRLVFIYRICSCLALLVCNRLVSAQGVDPYSLFSLTGVSTAISSKTNLNLYGVYNPFDQIKAIAAIPLIRVNKYVTLSPSCMYVSLPGSRKEFHILGSAQLAFPLGKHVTLEDRNMWWHRFRESELPDLDFYRNRLRFIYQKSMRDKTLRLFAGNEFFYSFDQGRFSRNRLGFGAGYPLVSWLTAEAVYTWQVDRNLPNRSVAFLTLTVPLDHYGVFRRRSPNPSKQRNKQLPVF